MDGARLDSETLSDTEAWLAERWAEQLGPLPITANSDFFTLGGTSMAAAKLVSVLRERFRAAAVADIYDGVGGWCSLPACSRCSSSRRPNGCSGSWPWTT